MRRWILNFIEIIILVVISLVCIVSVLQSTIFKNASIFGYRNYVIASNSMYPVLEYGDVILVKTIDYDLIEVGDVITYKGEEGEFKGKIITHEVIEINQNDKGERVLQTKGRANTGIDPEVSCGQVYGKLFYRFVVLSFMSKMVRDNLGFVLFIFIPFSILFVLEFINMVKESKRRELEKSVKRQLDELKRINDKTDKCVSIENTMVLQLEQIMSAKRDFKKMNELEKTVRISFEDIKAEIERLKEENNVFEDDSKDNLYLDETLVLFDVEDIKKEIQKEFKIKGKKVKKAKKMKNNVK